MQNAEVESKDIAMNTNDIVVAVLILIPLDSITRARRMHYSTFVFPMLMSLGFNIASAFKLFRVRVVRNAHTHTQVLAGCNTFGILLLSHRVFSVVCMRNGECVRIR